MLSKIVVMCWLGLALIPAFSQAGDQVRISGFEILKWQQSLGNNPGDWPTLTFDKSEAYLYGHGPDTVNTLSVADDSVRINGVPVGPKLHDTATQPREFKATAEDVARYNLDERIATLKREMRAGGASDVGIGQAMVKALCAEPTLVDSAAYEPPGIVSIWWRGLTVRDERSVYEERDSAPRSDIDQLRDTYVNYRCLLEQGSLLIITTQADFSLGLSWTKEVQVVRDEIQRARAATEPLTTRTWTPKYLLPAIAEQLRKPLPMTAKEN